MRVNSYFYLGLNRKENFGFFSPIATNTLDFVYFYKNTSSIFSILQSFTSANSARHAKNSST